MKVNRLLFLIVIASALTFTCDGHTVNYDMSSLNAVQTGWAYIVMGFKHIIPFGADHILFVLGLFFLNPKIKNALWQATAFTMAHSITLALAVFGFINPPSEIIEPLIALSIVIVAIENIYYSQLSLKRILLVFLFGLLHGCGFASALTEAGLPEKNYILGIASFNVGVELGQIFIILAAWLIIGKSFSAKSWYRKSIVIPACICIGLIAVYWTVQRTFNII